MKKDYLTDNCPDRGRIQIVKELVERNNMGWNKFDFFRNELRRFSKDLIAGWYAYKEEEDHYIFLWCKFRTKLSPKYLKALREDGYELP